MNKSMIGALVVAMALLPSFASATSTAYAVDIGESEVYFVDGVLTVQPSLDEDHGDAFIVSSLFLGTQWRVEVMCDDESSENCDGFILS